MIQICGLIVAVYCVCRLWQIPLQDQLHGGRQSTGVVLLSVFGSAAIGLLSLMLLMG